jgi:hypothetical protein
MRTPSLRYLPLAALLLASAPAAGAELYKWVDENGVVNYSNTPPPKTRTGKPPTVVEDRLSVYTPEKSITEEIERNKDRRTQKPPAASSSREPEPDPRPRVTMTAPPAFPYDPCLDPSDRNCSVVIYDGPPVFHGRRRQPPLVQPQLPPGTIAGQGAGSGAFIPGQSGTAQPLPVRPRRSSGAGFTSREPEREGRHSR